LQEAEFASEDVGYTAVRHQREVGTGYFDAVSVAISGGQSSTTAMAASTEAQQFHHSHVMIDYHNNHESLHAEFDDVYGNGGPGLLEELKREAHYTRLKETYKEIEEFAHVEDDY
jgi:isocitrate lyase